MILAGNFQYQRTICFYAIATEKNILIRQQLSVPLRVGLVFLIGYFIALQFSRIFSTAEDQRFHSLSPEFVQSNSYMVNTTKITINRTDTDWATETKLETKFLNIKQTLVKTDIINEV